MGFFLHSAVLALYALLGYFPLRFYALALFGGEVEGGLAGELPFVVALVVATVVGGSLLQWKPGLRAHLFLVGITLSLLVYGLTWALLLSAGFLAQGDVADWGRVLHLALVGWLTLLPVGLPLGWGLVLVSQSQADCWSARRGRRELQA